jgi:hypothetical protein
MPRTTYPGLDLDVLVKNGATHGHPLLSPDLASPQAQALLDAGGPYCSQPNATCLYYGRDTYQIWKRLEPSQF